MSKEGVDDGFVKATDATFDVDDIFETHMTLSSIEEEDVKHACKLIDERHPLATLPLVDALPAFRLFSRCCSCVNSRRGSGRGPKKIEDWLKKRQS